jgi:hypothetical protein
MLTFWPVLRGDALVRAFSLLPGEAVVSHCRRFPPLHVGEI